MPWQVLISLAVLFWAIGTLFLVSAFVYLWKYTKTVSERVTVVNQRVNVLRAQLEQAIQPAPYRGKPQDWR